MPTLFQFLASSPSHVGIRNGGGKQQQTKLLSLSFSHSASQIHLKKKNLSSLDCFATFPALCTT